MRASTVITYDSINQKLILFQEEKPLSAIKTKENLYSKGFVGENIPDFYFVTLIIVLALIAWFRVFYGKFLNFVWLSAYSYQGASKVYNDQSIIQKRFGRSLDVLYLINGTLFIYILDRFFNTNILGVDAFAIIWVSFSILLGLILLRIAVMRIAGFIFQREGLYKSYLFHFFVYNKVLGLILTPFLIAIPYTKGFIQETIVFTGVSVVIIILIIRLIRSIIFVLKNDVLLFYLILYLCTLEILPIVVVFKFLISLARV